MSDPDAGATVPSVAMLAALDSAAASILERWRKTGRIPFLLETNVEEEIRGVIGAIIEAVETERPPSL
ncbi:MAG: hypothetical protein ACRELV_12745, partial [Longimicrobiales bacterium]